LAVVGEQGPECPAACPSPPAERWFASHELRTALQAVRGGLDLLLASTARGLSTSQLEAVSLIAGAASDLERHTDELAELWQLIESPPPPAQRIELRCLLASPSIARWITPQPKLVAAWDGLKIGLDPEVATRAFQHLARFAGDDHAIPIDLVAVRRQDVALLLSLPQPSAGNGAIAWHLARQLCRRAGFSCDAKSGVGCVLTLQLDEASTMAD
jgi:hypothetical protein